MWESGSITFCAVTQLLYAAADFPRARLLMSAIYNALETTHNTLLNHYDENVAIVQALQQTLIQDIIPDVLDEMEGMSVLYDEEGIKRWAWDSGMCLLRRQAEHILTNPSRKHVSCAEGACASKCSLHAS